MRFATGTKRPPVAAFRRYQPKPLRSILTQFKPPRHAGFHVLKLVLKSFLMRFVVLRRGWKDRLRRPFPASSDIPTGSIYGQSGFFPSGGFMFTCCSGPTPRTHSRFRNSQFSKSKPQVLKLAVSKIKTVTFETCSFRN